MSSQWLMLGVLLVVLAIILYFSFKTEPTKAETRTEELNSSRYAAARTVVAIEAFIGWAVVIIGALLLVIAFTDASRLSLLALAPPLAIVFAGLLIVGAAQLVAAALDTADNTRRIAELLEKRN